MMFMLIIQSLLLIALAYLIGCLAGCLARRLLGAADAPKYVPLTHTTDGENAAISVIEGPFVNAMQMETPLREDTAAAQDNAPGPVSVRTIHTQTVAISLSEGDHGAAAKADKAGTRPKVLKQPLGSGADNLKRIKGIGPKNEKALNNIGIFHFAQIASLSSEEAAWIGAFLAFPDRIEREDWIGQAGLLAAGTASPFSSRVDKDEVVSSKDRSSDD